MEKVKERFKESVFLAAAGILAGVANGFFGGGGGMLVVPFYIFLLKREPKRAHATALIVILPLTLISGLIYVGLGNFELSAGLPSVLGVVAGGVVGAILLKKLKSGAICTVFSAVMLIAGGMMAFGR